MNFFYFFQLIISLLVLLSFVENEATLQKRMDTWGYWTRQKCLKECNMEYSHEYSDQWYRCRNACFNPLVLQQELETILKQLDDKIRSEGMDNLSYYVRRRSHTMGEKEAIEMGEEEAIMQERSRILNEINKSKP